MHTTGVICVELVRKLQDAGARFTEVGVHHYRRVFGKSEFFRLGAIVRTLWDLAGLWVQLVVLRRGRTRRSVSGSDATMSTEVPNGTSACASHAAFDAGEGREHPIERALVDVGARWACRRRCRSRSTPPSAAAGGARNE